MDVQKKLFSDAAHTGVGGVYLQKNSRVLVFLSYFTRKREGVGVCVLASQTGEHKLHTGESVVIVYTTMAIYCYYHIYI
jgi:hypothetical protein